MTEEDLSEVGVAGEKRRAAGPRDLATSVDTSQNGRVSRALLALLTWLIVGCDVSLDLGSRSDGEICVCAVEDHLPDTFVGCFGDANGDGTVTGADLDAISANTGSVARPDLCVYDMDGNGAINGADRGAITAVVGQCLALPLHQNGSGLRGGPNPEPDLRFPCP